MEPYIVLADKHVNGRSGRGWRSARCPMHPSLRRPPRACCGVR